jgi:DNA-binding response OmpR family regulator
MDVLVVEDEPGTRALVRRVLEREGIAVAEAASGAAAVEQLRREPVDVVLLDLGLPDASGLEVLQALRAIDPTVAVVMVTASDSEADRVRGLVSGADDYVVKPFSVRELAARVMAIGRRLERAHLPVIERGDLRIDLAGRRVTRASRPIDLTAREFDLLAHLARHAGVTFTRDQLLSAVWRSSAEWQDEATVTEHVRRLRIKLQAGADEASVLTTVRGVGYRFEAPGPADVP